MNHVDPVKKVFPKLAFLDQVGAIIVSVFIIKVGLDILFTSINELLDIGMPKQELLSIEKAIISNANVRVFSDNARCQVLHVFGHTRIRQMIGEITIRLAVQLDHLVSIIAPELRRDRPGRGIAGIYDYFKLFLK